MTDTPMPRRLAAIVVADIYGYSRLTTIDEEGTVRRFGELMDSVIKPAIEENEGRFVKHTGDGFIGEFSSVAAAFRCSTQIQTAFAAMNESAKDAGSEDEPLLLRIGIDIGDIIVKQGDVFGNGVNIAARLEGLAAAGGICVSQRAREHLDQFQVNFVDLGEQRLKNISEPVRAFQVSHDPVSTGYLLQHKTIYRRSLTWAGIAAVVTAIVVGAYMLWPRGVGDPQVYLDDRLAEMQCSWLAIREFSNTENGVEVSISGASANPGSSVQRALYRQAEEAGITVHELHVRHVVPMEASQCDLVEGLRQYRHRGISRLEATETTVDGDEGVRFTLLFDPEELAEYANIYSIDPDGEMILAESRDALVARAELRENGQYGVDYVSDHTGWGGILLMESNAPIDNDLVLSLADPAGDRESFAEAAEQNDWSFELVWLNSDMDNDR